TAGQHRLGTGREVDGGDRVDRLAVAGVVLAYADQPVTGHVHVGVGVPHAFGAGQRFRGRPGHDPVDALVFEVRGVHGAVGGDRGRGPRRRRHTRAPSSGW